MQDPVHGFIPIDSELYPIIDSAIFQRLDHVRQLSAAQYVFPGAHHTRKQHCLGAMHLANLYSQSLFGKNNKILAMAALLHDIGHGSYSHSWDSTVYSQIYENCEKGHDKHRYKIVKKLFPHIADDIIAIWQGKDMVLSAIISGPLSVDRFDFIRRDIFFTGTSHFGYLDYDRIIRNASVYKKNNGTDVLCYDEKIIPDIIQGLTTRLYMYVNVYLHKTVIAAGVLIEAAIKTSLIQCNWIERTVNLEKFIYLNDGIINEILQSDNPELSDSKYYADRLYRRELPKMVSETISHNLANHQAGITIKDDQITWVSRILSNDFCKEFSKFDIHIETNDGCVPFKEYWDEHYPDHKLENYYIVRTYSL